MESSPAHPVQPHAPFWVRAIPLALVVGVAAGLLALPLSPLKPAEQARYLRAAEFDAELAASIETAMTDGRISGYEAMPLWLRVNRVLNAHPVPVEQDVCSLPTYLASAGSAEANTAKEGPL